MQNHTAGQAAGVPLRFAGTMLVIGAATGFLIVLFMAISAHGNPVSMYVRDPAAVFKFSPLAGMISHLGVFALMTAGIVCIFSSLHLPSRMSLLFWVGVFSLLIAIDDFFMIHEDLALQVGLSEVHVLALYGLFALAISYVFRTSLIGKSHIGLYAGTSLLAASVVADMVMSYSDTLVVLEDSLKFVGLIVWSTYWVRRAHLTLAEARQGEQKSLSAEAGARRSSQGAMPNLNSPQRAR